MASPLRILVVDDDLAIRQSIAELLEDEGYAVTCASNGAEALAMLESLEAPALILLDLMMPVMDGWAFRTAQRNDPRLARIPVLAMSACLAGDARASGLVVDAFLAKPFDLETLVASVHRFC